MTRMSETTPLFFHSRDQDTQYSGISDPDVVLNKDKDVVKPSFIPSTGHATPLVDEPSSSETPCRCCGHCSEYQATRTTKSASDTWRNTLLSWYHSDFVSLSLENSGSVARDHLASERTFLAYVRTSLAVASSGVALIQLFTVASNHHSQPDGVLPFLSGPIEPYVRPLGAATILVGLSVLIIGVFRYFIIQSSLTRGNFPAARMGVGFVTVSMTALVTVTFSILLAGRLHPGPNLRT
ncbi:hypothetical protein CC1G_02953 [Coprinopsis cinerea okayama7|uniref:DUF202 domain-containing protein n=1 Tax=Coprinopsis cinerea (strain Okayama-7 / 130 / ATCC MYA-4618 / FGSC 9003) TaxID=240176 RepID=A8NRV5_COPC7|nr:hypothetical protein CC1G_02953 [Coprinopsis cinerea okayama7\|eukprot:XP_001835865.2 hypothetical protein CC1G_02953 [Coprinopsis cinerea okayama7\